MVKQNIKILILEKDISFQTHLKDLCGLVGKVWTANNVDQALSLITRHSFQLLLLDWDSIQSDISNFQAALDNFQPEAGRIALLSSPRLNEVITAMKSGMNDVLWPHEDSTFLQGKIMDVFFQEHPAAIGHSYVSKLAESMAEKAIVQKSTLARARKEFSKVFLGQMLRLQKMRHFQLASLMNVTSRTLRRHLSK